jgi:hypothetical protein
MTVQKELEDLVAKYGFGDVLAALCSIANERGYAPLFRRLNKVYEATFYRRKPKEDKAPEVTE